MNMHLFVLGNNIASLVYVFSNRLLWIIENLLFSHKELSSPRVILVLRTGSLGDTLCAIPAMRKVRRSFPEAKIILMTARESNSFKSNPQNILKDMGLYNGLIVYSPRSLYNLKHIRALSRRIKNQEVDLLVYLSQADSSVIRLLRDMFFFYLAGCKRVCGLRLSKHLILRLPQKYCRNFDQEAERLLKIVSPEGISRSDMVFNLPVNPANKKKVDDLLPADLELNNRLIIAVSPGTNMAVKHWPVEKFIKLCRILQEENRAFIIILGDKKDMPVSRMISRQLKYNCVDLTGQTSIREAAEILGRCDYLVSCDSGMVHLAAGVGISVIGIYTARDYPHCWYPWGDNHIIIRHDVHCQVCLKSECKVMECIKGINVDDS